MSSIDRKFTETGLPWHIVEEAINNEIEWLERVIEQTVIGKVPGCDDCRYTYRKIALLIVTGKITAKEFVARDGHMDLFVEIGTTSAYKLWWNLQVLTNCKVLLVPDEKRAIEFICRSEGQDIVGRP